MYRKRRQIGALDGNLREQWKTFLERREAVQRQVALELQRIEADFQRENARIASDQEMLWADVYRHFEIDPAGTYSISETGEIWEVDALANSGFEDVMVEQAAPEPDTGDEAGRDDGRYDVN
jgi:hypothetical protein